MAAGPVPEPSHRKRRRSDTQINPRDIRNRKRVKRSEGTFSTLETPAFWDNLSKIPLTKRALQELDRRQVPSTAVISRPQEPSRLKDIARFARCGGPRLEGLRGYQHQEAGSIADVMRSKSSGRSLHTRSTGLTSYTSASTNRTKSSAYDAGFEQHLVDNGIFPAEHEYADGRKTPEPDNLESIQERLQAARASLSPSKFDISAFHRFKKQNSRTIGEPKVMSSIMPIIHGNHHGIPNEEDLLFTNLDSMTKDMTVKPKPDFYDGTRQHHIDSRVQQRLGSVILPTRRDGAAVLPNFFAEVKAPGGGADVVRRQACHNGAIGARAMHELQSYGEPEPIYDNNAYTISSTFHNGNLKLYAIHPTQTKLSSRTTEYHMTQLDGWDLTGNYRAFKQGVSAFRNGREWAQEQRNSFVGKANAASGIHVAGVELSDEHDNTPRTHTPGSNDAQSTTVQCHRNGLVKSVFPEPDSPAGELMSQPCSVTSTTHKRPRTFGDEKGKVARAPDAPISNIGGSSEDAEEDEAKGQRGTGGFDARKFHFHLVASNMLCSFKVLVCIAFSG